MQRSTLAIVLALSGLPCAAHEDRILSRDADGRLGGLPAQYEPAWLRLGFDAGHPGGPRLSGLELQVGNQSTRLPACVTDLVQTRSAGDVRVLASWYHDTSLLPHYVGVTLNDPPGGDTVRGRFDLLFDLGSTKLISMHVEIPRENGKRLQRIDVDLASMCPPAEFHGFAWRENESNVVEFSTSLDFGELDIVLRHLEAADAAFAAELTSLVADFRISSEHGDTKHRALADGHGYVVLEREEPQALTIAVYSTQARVDALDAAYEAALPAIEGGD